MATTDIPRGLDADLVPALLAEADAWGVTPREAWRLLMDGHGRRRVEVVAYLEAATYATGR